jgi:hypothetical protein
LRFSQSGDAFWDAAQHQLQATGELHNNVRMTWGKALLPWAAAPQEALALALHLNHRHALDGCDPCSYSGVLWCFGQVGAVAGLAGRWLLTGNAADTPPPPPSLPSPPYPLAYSVG